MDRPGSKKGGGGVLGENEQILHRKNRLRQLQLQQINLEKDPYFGTTRNGLYECKLCLTVHTTEASYLSHRPGRKHQENLIRRAAFENQRNNKKLGQRQPSTLENQGIQVYRGPKIGRPNYKISKIRDPVSRKLGLFFEVKCPDASKDPIYRWMGAFEQKIEEPNNKFKYMVIAIEPYATCAFKVENKPVDKIWDYFDRDEMTYYLQVMFE